jgi:hypothetical protein
MPDQHAAATEHELISTVTEPLGQLPEDPLAAVPVDFPVALRGYDRIAVDAYVARTTQLVAELQSTRSPEAAVRRALQRVGEEIAGILQRAHDTADEITARSRSEAEERLETARREALELTADAERRVAELDAETDRIWAERHSIVTDVRELASRLTGLAEEALGRFPADGAPDIVQAPAHPFDGAVEVSDLQDPLLEDEPAISEDQLTIEQPVAEEPVLDALLAFEPELESTFEPEPEPTFEPEPEPTVVMEPPIGFEPGDAEHGGVDQPTADMPPIEPWEGVDPGPFDPHHR